MVDGGVDKISESAILTLLIVALTLFCLCSLAGYIFYRRKMSEEFFEAITETDERFL